jgi:hypothetical protein
MFYCAWGDILLYLGAKNLMTTLTVTDITHLGKNNKQKQKFDQLWADVEKKKLRNERYQTKLDNFYNDFIRDLEPQEKAVCLAAEQWIKHLLSFVGRKTIKGTQREELYNWIQEELTIIEANPFNPVDLNQLRKVFNDELMALPSMNQAIDIPSDELDALRDELFEMVGELPLSDEELADMVRNPEKFHAFLEALLKENRDKFDDSDEDSAEFEDFFDDSDFSSHFAEKTDDEEMSLELFKGKAMTKLYRQLAKLFHPDKEADVEKKAEKQVLMQKLSQAKKDKDPLAMLLLAQEYLPDHEITVDDAMLKRLESALRANIAKLNQEFQQMQHGGDIKSTIWVRFGGGNKASRERALEKYKQSLSEEAEALLARCTEIKTVKALQGLLRERVNNSKFERQFMEQAFFESMFD